MNKKLEGSASCAEKVARLHASAMYRGSVSTFADLSVAFGAAPCHVQRVHFWHLKSAYFLETRVGASLVRGPWLPPRGCYVMCDVAVRSQIRTTRFKRVFEWGVKQAPRKHRIQNVEGSVLDPCAKSGPS